MLRVAARLLQGCCSKLSRRRSRTGCLCQARMLCSATTSSSSSSVRPHRGERIRAPREGGAFGAAHLPSHGRPHVRQLGRIFGLPEAHAHATRAACNCVVMDPCPQLCTGAADRAGPQRLGRPRSFSPLQPVPAGRQGAAACGVRQKVRKGEVVSRRALRLRRRWPAAWRCLRIMKACHYCDACSAVPLTSWV